MTISELVNILITSYVDEATHVEFRYKGVPIFVTGYHRKEDRFVVLMDTAFEAEQILKAAAGELP